MTQYDCFAASVAGSETGSNEDSVLVDPDHGVFVVCDGLGGQPGGAQASRLAADAFAAHVRAARLRGALSRADLLEAVSVADNAVRSAGAQDACLSGSGTTLSAVVARGAHATLVHVGDSRIYSIKREGVFQLTRDQTLVAELVERGHLAASAAGRHPLRHVVTQVLGSARSLEPEIDDVSLEGVQWLILATDGLSNAITEHRLEELCRREGMSTAEQLCRSLIEAAVPESPDDVSVAVVGMSPPPGFSPESTRRIALNQDQSERP
jgi:serine/threonine protein phosphatase PrpC